MCPPSALARRLGWVGAAGVTALAALMVSLVLVGTPVNSSVMGPEARR